MVSESRALQYLAQATFKFAVGRGWGPGEMRASIMLHV